jgi:hypothetical protein
MQTSNNRVIGGQSAQDIGEAPWQVPLKGLCHEISTSEFFKKSKQLLLGY